MCVHTQCVSAAACVCVCTAGRTETARLLRGDEREGGGLVASFAPSTAVPPQRERRRGIIKPPSLSTQFNSPLDGGGCQVVSGQKSQREWSNQPTAKVITHTHSFSLSLSLSLSLSFTQTPTHMHIHTPPHAHLHTHIHNLSFSISHRHTHTHAHTYPSPHSLPHTHTHTHTHTQKKETLKKVKEATVKEQQRACQGD